MKKFCDYAEKAALTKNPIQLENIKTNKHFIYYSCNNYVNYCECMRNLTSISNTLLKYSRKTNIIYNNEEYFFNISDVHIEIDFELLGVNEYNIFFELFNHVKDNIILNKKIFFIVCLHFNSIKKELLDVFYNFMNEPSIKFIFLTTNLSFMNNKLFKNAIIKKCKGEELSKYNKGYETNIKELSSIIQNFKISLFQLREKLYSLLIMNYNIYDCFQYLIECLINDKYINTNNINSIMKEYLHIMEKYNNNYRTIYHLENFIILLINLNKKVK